MCSSPSMQCSMRMSRTLTRTVYFSLCNRSLTTRSVSFRPILCTQSRLRSNGTSSRNTQGQSGDGGEKSGGRLFGTWRWFSIPVSSGIAFLAVLQLLRIVRRERKQSNYDKQEPETWQLAMFRLLPARMLSRLWGDINSKELPTWLRHPLLGLYVWVFGCNMSEAVIQDLSQYSSLVDLFTRQLQYGTREVSRHHQLVCPSDGKVLHFGRVEDGKLEQVKGVTYKLHKFLGPEQRITSTSGNTVETIRDSDNTETASAEERELYHVIFYLAPGDYHHFHSPADWKVTRRRHFPGELLTVAPWAARTMPGLFSLNERAILSGRWEHGFFSMAAVGAFNVGSIQLAIDKDLQTNKKGRYKMGEYRDKDFIGENGGLNVKKGDRVGGFNLGSSIVLVFEAPKNFQFSVEVGQKVYYGQPLGVILNGKSTKN